MASAAAKQPKADVYIRDQEIEYFNHKILDTYQKISSILKVPLYILVVHNPRGIGRIVVTISVLDDPITTIGGMPSVFNEDNGDSGYILKPGAEKEILTSAHVTNVVENENSICNLCGERARFNFSFIIEKKYGMKIGKMKMVEMKKEFVKESYIHMEMVYNVDVGHTVLQIFLIMEIDLHPD